MAMRSLLLLLPLLVSTAFPTSHAFPTTLAASRKEAIGGWKTIRDVDDDHVREIAEFAVAEHNRRQQAQLTFSKVVSGETQVVSGINYRLVLQAEDRGGVAAEYEAVVWEKAWMKVMHLTSFVPLEP